MRITFVCKTISKIFREETMASVGELFKKNRKLKNPEVLVHGTQANDDEADVHGNISSRSRHRHKPSNYLDVESAHLYKHKHGKSHTHYSPHDETIAERSHDDGVQQQRTSKRHLQRDNDRLMRENELLQEKCSASETVLNKKIARLKEKLTTIQSFNNDVVEENNTIKARYQETVANVEEYRNSVENRICPVCERLKGALEKNNMDYNALKCSNKELNEDVRMLKNVVYRLNVQLGRYQEKLYENNIHLSTTNVAIPSNLNRTSGTADISERIETTNAQTNVPLDNHVNHTHSPISWGKVNVHTLGPLLDAYQDTIAEKEELIRNYELEMSNFTVKLKDVVKENERLHENLTADDKCSVKLTERLVNLKGELKTVKEQNDLLIKKCAVKQDKLEEVLKFYEQKVEVMSRDYKVLHEQYFKGRAEVAALTEKNKALIARQDDFKTERQKFIPLEVHNTSVEECRKLYEELKVHYENEKLKLTNHVQNVNDKTSELGVQIKALNRDKEDLQSTIKSLESKLKKGESKYIDLQHTCSEVQLSRSACRKQLHKAMNFAKELVSEQESLLKQLNERQQENKTVKMLGSNIVDRMDSLKSQLKTVQRDAFQELTVVEQRMQEKNCLISAMKQEHEDEIKKLHDIIRERDDSVVLKESALPVPYYLLYKDRNG